MIGKQGIGRRLAAAAVAMGVVGGLLTTTASGAGNKFTWSKNGFSNSKSPRCE